MPKRNYLWQKILLSYVIVALVPLLIAAFIAINLINTQIEKQAEITLNKNLDYVSSWFYQRSELVHFYLDTMVEVEGSDNLLQMDEGLQPYLSFVKDKNNLSFLTLVSVDGCVLATATSEVLTGNPENDSCYELFDLHGFSHGVTILSPSFLEEEGLLERAYVETVGDAGEVDGVEDRGLALAAAVPLHDKEGQLKAYLFGGELLNKNLAMVDEISANWQNTATLFLEDVRVATSVRLISGERATGTRLSEEVSGVVLGQGERFLGRAYIVDDWYLTAYDPIYNESEEIIGALYLGGPEEPFVQIKRDTVARFFLIALFGIALAILAGYLILRSIKHPLQKFIEAMRKVQSGDLSQRLKE